MNIKEIAEQVGDGFSTLLEVWMFEDEQLETFAALIRQDEAQACAKHYLDIMRDAVEQAVAKEREACAKIVDENLFLLVAAAAIRARGEK